MSHSSQPEVYTAAEVAAAAGVPVSAVEALIAAGELVCIDGTRFVAESEAIRVGRRLRNGGVSGSGSQGVAAGRHPTPVVHPRRRAVATSTVLHAGVLLLVVGLGSGRTETAPVNEPVDTTRLVFVVTPGPGGGGGGGGLRYPRRASRLQRRAERPARVTVPEVAPDPAPLPTPPPEPPAVAPVVAPVVATAADSVDADVAQTGAGTGEGQGSGIGEGSGGGVGGGPYRPGSGIEPPRLLREVKAEYSDEARRRNLRGDVLLEIVVRRDGSVGDVRVLQGLGGGLDERAVAAVRQWRFAPARRLGSPVDVIVEVAVEFNLR